MKYYSITCFIPNHRIHNGHTMVHFLDAVIKLVMFLEFFLKRSKQIVKKICKNQGGEGFVKRLGSRLVSGKYHKPLAGDGTNCRQ